MKKLSLLIITLFFLILVAGCSRNERISVLKTNHEFIVEFSKLNSYEQHDIYLEEGTIVKVDIENEGGELSISVSNTNSIYTGNNPTSTNFSLTIPSSGTYHFSIYGQNAKGSVSFIVK